MKNTILFIPGTIPSFAPWHSQTSLRTTESSDLSLYCLNVFLFQTAERVKDIAPLQYTEKLNSASNTE